MLVLRRNVVWWKSRQDGQDAEFVNSIDTRYAGSYSFPSNIGEDKTKLDREYTKLRPQFALPGIREIHHESAERLLICLATVP